MRTLIRCLPLLATLSLPSIAAAQQPTVIRGARVFDGERVLPATDVLIRAGRIAAVDVAVDMPAGAHVVDARGMTLLPGLIDSHTHAFGDALREALVFGVTTELDMFTEPGLAAAMRAEQRAGAVPDRADLYSASVLVTAPRGHGTEYGFPIPTLTSADEAQAFVDARVAEGSDWIKIVYDDGALFGLDWPTLELPVVRALVDATHRRGRLAVVHISTRQQARDVIGVGADGLVHLFTDSMPSQDFIDAVKASDAFVIPTLVVLKSITGVAGAAPLAEDVRLDPYLMPSSKANLEASFPPRPGAADQFTIPLATVKQLHAAGVPILAGTDAPNPGTSHGAAIHRELELLVEAGLSPLEALRAATRTPAEAFDLRDRGRIAEGLRADLLLVHGDPTTDITATRAIEGVWKGGVRLDRGVYRQAVADARSVARAAGSGPGLISDFEDGSMTARMGTPWVPNTDSFAGGTSTVTPRVVDGGASGSAKALRVSGTITDSFTQPWAGVMWSPGTQPMQPADLSATEGLRFQVRGDGRTMRVLVFASRHGMAPQAHTLTAPAEWAEVTLPWSTFDTDGSDVLAVMFVGAAPAGDFWFEVDNVALR